MDCNNDCLNCQLLVCKHDIADRKEYLNRFDKLKEKKRHSEYYQKHREAILAKQKERDKDRQERTKKYYEKNKEKIKRQHRKLYAEHREERVKKQAEYYALHREEILQRRREKRLHDKRKTESM